MTAEEHARFSAGGRPYPAATPVTGVGRRAGLMAGLALLLGGTVLHGNLLALPTLTVPDPDISRVFSGNWKNTLQPCKLQAGDSGQVRIPRGFQVGKPSLQLVG